MSKTELLRTFEQALLTRCTTHSLKEMAEVLRLLRQHFKSSGFQHKQHLIGLMESIVASARSGEQPVTGSFVLLMLRCYDFLNPIIESECDIPQDPCSIVLDNHLLGVELLRMANMDPNQNPFSHQSQHTDTLKEVSHDH